MPGHVVFLECYPHIRGGAQTTTAALAEHLPARGWTTEVVAPSGGAALDAYRAAGVPTTVLMSAPALRRYGGEHRRIDEVAAAAALPAWTARLARHLRDRDATLLAVIDQRGIVLGAAAARIAGVRGVWHIHTPGPSSLLDRVGRRWARVCIAPSRAAGARLGAGVSVIPPALVRLPPPMPPPPDDAPPRVVTAGRLHSVKGFDVLIDAIATLATRVDALSLEIYGDAQAGHEDYARALVARVERAGLHDRVTFVGHQDCPWAHWHGASVYVQPSRSEPFGLALIEAMACGLPVVATRVDGPSEILEHGRTGLLVAPGDARALANAIEQLLTDRASSQVIAAAGRAHVLETYTVERLARDTADAYDRAVA